MKRSLLLLVPALAFALGAGAARTFSYLPANLNAPMTVTNFEWRAACADINRERLDLGNQILVSSLRADPGKSGVYVYCTAQRDPAAPLVEADAAKSMLARALSVIGADAKKRFSAPSGRMVIMLSTNLGGAARVFGQDHFLLAQDMDAESRRDFPIQAFRAAETGHW